MPTKFRIDDYSDAIRELDVIKETAQKIQFVDPQWGKKPRSEFTGGHWFDTKRAAVLALIERHGRKLSIARASEEKALNAIAKLQLDHADVLAVSGDSQEASPAQINKP